MQFLCPRQPGALPLLVLQPQGAVPPAAGGRLLRQRLRLLGARHRLLGITTVSYVTATGADPGRGHRLDAADNTFSTVDPVCTTTLAATCVATDIEHRDPRIGHLLGLAHTAAPPSTMNATSMTGDLSKREMDPGPRLQLRGLPGRAAGPDCVPGPDGGMGLAGPSRRAAPRRQGAWGRSWPGPPTGRGRRAGRLAPLLAAAPHPGHPGAGHHPAGPGPRHLTRSSDLVVRATVKQVRPAGPRTTPRIVTDVELEVSEAWKGLPGQR